MDEVREDVEDMSEVSQRLGGFKLPHLYEVPVSRHVAGSHPRDMFDIGKGAPQGCNWLKDLL